MTSSTLTKGQIVRKAISILIPSSSEFDFSATDYQQALDQLDDLMASWYNIYLGYIFPADPYSSRMEDPSGIPDFARKAVYFNLASDLSSVFGKPLTPDIFSKAAATKNDLYANMSALIPMRQYPRTLPRGEGNKPIQRNNGGIYMPGEAPSFTVTPTGTEVTT